VLFAFGFIFLFTLGGVAGGAVLANAALEIYCFQQLITSCSLSVGDQ